MAGYGITIQAIVKAAFALVSIATSETNAQMMILTVEIYTTVDLPCSCNINPERTNTVHWYRSSNPDSYVKKGQAIASWAGGPPTNTPGYEIRANFSMVVRNITLNHQGLYRCIVTPVGGGDESTNDVKVNVYANADGPPVIQYFGLADKINVTCSISHVFPSTFPKLTSYEGNGTKETEEINEDGTYNTSVSHLFQLADNDTNIQCLYSNANFKSMSSLVITDYTDQFVIEDQGLRNGSCPTLKGICSLSGLWIVCLTFVLEIFWLIMIVFEIKTGRISAILHATHATWRIKHSRPHHEGTGDEMGEINIMADQPVYESKNDPLEHGQTHHEHDKETREEIGRINVKADQPVDQNGNGTVWPVIMIASQVMVIILLAAYLGIAIASKK